MMQNQNQHLKRPLFSTPGLPVGGASIESGFLDWLASGVSQLLRL